MSLFHFFSSPWRNLSFFILLIPGFLVSFSNVSAASFSDIPQNHPQYAAVESLKNLGIVQGYSDGLFHPERPVNRVEALKMILQSAKIESPESSGPSGFTDISGDDWFIKYILKAKALGIVNGNPDGTFSPARQVNKAEFLKMLFQSFQIDLSRHQNSSELSADTLPGQWFLPYLSYAKAVGIIYPNLENNLEPNRALTRGECADIIYRLLILEKGGETQKLLNLTEAQLVNLLVELNSNNISGALQNAATAVSYSAKALELSPTQAVAKAAHILALAFQKLCLAYEAGISKNYDLLRQYVEDAKNLAAEAYAAAPSTQPLGQKIKTQGDILLGQIPAN